MIFSINPEFEHKEEIIKLIDDYDVNLEYSEFTLPSVYENEGSIQNRIDYYRSLKRDRSQDTLHGAFLGIDITAEDSVLRDRSKALCEQSMVIAKQLAVKGVVFHTGLIGGLRLDYYLDNWLKQSVDFWTGLCQKYPDIIIYIENSFEQEPDMLIKLMESMKNISNIKICLDYGHATLTKTPIEEWCSRLAPYIGHMHLNDNDLDNDLHLVPGDGKIDFERWKELMKSNNIQVSTLLELNGTDNMRRALEYMKKF